MSINYYQGETVGFYMEGDAIIDLEANEWKVLFYNSQARTSQYEMIKSDFSLVSANKYYGEIPYEITQELQRGGYIREILFGANYRSIAKDNVFSLTDTEIK